ncbi:glycosyltransferase family 39 protein [Rhizophagus clarus]|uniref:Glycosyltransferase family 39 protein n=1 Tax=Rhizophagus clarus TaxID=94130 RepID=A0A8H3QCV0_9GLOM|nr:glycosyltransferase family 39 protein [Rhizophagus clarus]
MPKIKPKNFLLSYWTDSRCYTCKNDDPTILFGSSFCKKKFLPHGNTKSVTLLKTMMKFSVREWAELISDPITMKEQDQRVFRHADLPPVTDKLSITLRLKIHKHFSDWTTVFHKGNEHFIRTPILLLTANKSSLHPRFTGNWDSNAGIWDFNDGLLLNEWYHIAYTLSDPEKRLDIYLDGEWIGYYSIQQVKPQKVVFNDAPLHIGRNSHHGFDGEISNVRYFNWRLSPEEVLDDFLNKSQKKPILYGSKIALVHVSTGKYLSTKGIKYDFGSQNKQYMAICNGEEIDLENDIWSVIGASGKNIKEVTPISKQQQVTICPGGGNIDDDWLIRRYNPNISYDIGYLMNGDIIGLFHVRTNRPALYSHNALLGDGSQEVSCSGDGSECNNKWRIELIN